MAKQVQPDPFPVALRLAQDDIPTAPEVSVEMDRITDEYGPYVPSKLPEGVQMHDAAQPPRRIGVEGVEPERARKDPPPGWQGSYMRCGGCGDFLSGFDPCSHCVSEKPVAPQNMMIATPMKALV